MGIGVDMKTMHIFKDIDDEVVGIIDEDGSIGIADPPEMPEPQLVKDGSMGCGIVLLAIPIGALLVGLI